MMGDSRDDDEANRGPDRGERCKTFFFSGSLRMLFYDYFMVCGKHNWDHDEVESFLLSHIPDAVLTARTPRRPRRVERGTLEHHEGKETQMGARSSWQGITLNGSGTLLGIVFWLFLG
jgi:hypothetical protein